MNWNSPILGEQENQSPPELGDLGGKCVSPNLYTFAKHC